MNARALVRIDRGSIVRVVRPDAGAEFLLPTPEHAPAVYTPEGYLIVDAYLARDGLLQYSDGESSWWEYRPREELEIAAASWHLRPITDSHPSAMVDATTWARVANGIVSSPPVVEPPAANGVSYLRAKLLVTDAALIKRMESGQHELSIGFTGIIVPTEGFAEDGTVCDAVQTKIVGNHVASVEQGRAGPAVRIFLDGAAVPSTHWSKLMKIERPTTPAKPPVRSDAVGAPTETVPYMAPDGSEVQLPTWVVALLEKLATLEKQMVPAAPQPAAAPPADMPAPAAPADAKDEDKDEESKDSLEAVVQRRRRLERLAERAGVADSVIELSDNVALSKALIKARMPFAPVDSMRGDQLDALVATIAAMPVDKADSKPATKHTNVWDEVDEQPTNIQDAADPTSVAQQAFLKRQGYA